MKMSKIDEIKKLLSETNGNILDVFFVVYSEFLKDADSPGELLRVVLEYPKIKNADGASEYVSAKIETETMQDYLDYIKSTVSVLAKANNSVEEFYKNLWEMLFAAPTAPREAERCAVILMILRKKVVDIPYYQAEDVLSMSNDEFRKRFEKIEPTIDEAIHMMTQRFSQRTETTSQIYRLMKGLSREDACVFLAVIFNVLQKSVVRDTKFEREAGEDGQS